MHQQYSELLSFKVSDRASFAYGRYWLHKHQAVLQFDRVQQAIHERNLYSQGLEEPNLSNQESSRMFFHIAKTINKKVLAEIHLYFIAIDNLKDMMNTILSESQLTHLKRDLGKFLQSLDHYTHGRNTFEHYDERIPGGSKNDKVKEVYGKNGNPRKILEGLSYDVYKFGDKEWKIAPVVFQEIIDGIHEFEEKLHQFLDDSKGAEPF